jgi:hypothetical protein
MKKTFYFLTLALLVLLVQTGTAAELVVNGDFETGNFNGWTVTTAASGSKIFVYGGPAPHTGNYAAWYGATGGINDTISQVLPTIPAQKYTLSFWLRHPVDPGNNFTVTWGGTTLLNLVDSPSFPYKHFIFPNLSAPGGNTTISFAGREAGSWYLLDDVSVQGPAGVLGLTLLQGPLGPSAPVPGTLVLLGSGLLSLLGWRRLHRG